jgi:hypothetical protein
MSALTPKADIQLRRNDGRYGPIATGTATCRGVAAQSRRLQPFLLHGEQIGAAAGQQLEHGLGVFLRLAGLRRLVLEAGDGVVDLAQLVLDGFERIESGMRRAQSFIGSRPAAGFRPQLDVTESESGLPLNDGHWFYITRC